MQSEVSSLIQSLLSILMEVQHSDVQDVTLLPRSMGVHIKIPVLPNRIVKAYRILYRFILMEADSEISAWTRICVSHADCILLVGAEDAVFPVCLLPCSQASHRLLL